MMYINPEVYLKRITYTLEKVVAPEVESDFARGQVFAVIDLLNQLGGRIEYKQELLAREIKEGMGLIERLAGALEQAGIEPPREFAGLGGEAAGWPALERLEEALCAAIELLARRPDRLSPEAAAELDKIVRAQITQAATRGIGLMKPPMFDKISRPQPRPEKA